MSHHDDPRARGARPITGRIAFMSAEQHGMVGPIKINAHAAARFKERWCTDAVPLEHAHVILTSMLHMAEFVECDGRLDIWRVPARGMWFDIDHPPIGNLWALLNVEPESGTVESVHPIDAKKPSRKPKK